MKTKLLEICRSKSKTDLTEQEISLISSFGEAFEGAMNEETVERNKKLKEIADKVGSVDEGQTIAGVIRDLATKVDELEAKTKRTLSSDDKFKLRSMLEAKKDEIIAARKSKTNWELEFRAKRGASALMTTSTILTGASAINTVSVLDDMEVLVIQYPKNFIIDAIGGRTVPKVPEVLRWKEQNTESTDAIGKVTQGSTKQLTDKSFVWKTAEREKYAGRIEFTEELAMDFDQLLLQVIDMFEQQVIRSWNAGVLALVVAYCSAYTSTDLDGEFVSPGTSQVIQATKLWVEENNYMPDLLFIRPGDAALAKIQQNVNGDITYIPDEVAFHGLTPVINQNVPEGTLIVGTSSTIKEQHSNFILRRGTYGTQFIENEETIVGEVFSLLKLPTVSKASWISVNIETMKNALLKSDQQ